MTNEKNTTYDKTPCPICGIQISKNGAAYSAHARMHVRNNEAIEFKRGDKLVFLPSNKNYIDEEPYAKLGNDHLPGQPKNVWELPPLATELPAIDPSVYFITSGDAVKKADKLVKDVYALAAKCKALRDRLVKAKGEKKYLETVREYGKLLIKCKNPRKDNSEPEE